MTEDREAFDPGPPAETCSDRRVRVPTLVETGPTSQPTWAPTLVPGLGASDSQEAFDSGRPVEMCSDQRVRAPTRVPDIGPAEGQEAFDPGPPADAVLDATYDAELFDDCAYDHLEEDHPCDQEAC